MKSVKAKRAAFKVSDSWESPPLHILFTREDNVIVARCLDFTISSHGNDEKEAIHSLTEAVKEYLITALETNAINTIYDPAHSKYWRMFNEMEAKQISANLRRTLKKSVSAILEKKSIHSSIDVRYA